MVNNWPDKPSTATNNDETSIKLINIFIHNIRTNFFDSKSSPHDWIRQSSILRNGFGQKLKKSDRPTTVLAWYGSNVPFPVPQA